MTNPTPILYRVIESPIGDLLAIGDGTVVTGLFTPGHGRQPEPGWSRDEGPFDALSTQLDEYFAGDRTDFDLATSAVGTAFQESVWKALREIDYGQTASYCEVAARIGAPTAVRAVGAANGRNPLCIVVPCHRVIGADGSLTGYAGGIAAKRWLLEHEQRHASRMAPPVTRSN